jgi:hypothetical protein
MGNWMIACKRRTKASSMLARWFEARITKPL